MTYRQSFLTYLSAILVVSSNLLAIGTLIWTAITYPSGGLFEYIPLALVVYFLLPLGDLLSLLVALLAQWRKEPTVALRKMIYIVSIISYPIYCLILLVYFQIIFHMVNS